MKKLFTMAALAAAAVSVNAQPEGITPHEPLVPWGAQAEVIVTSDLVSNASGKWLLTDEAKTWVAYERDGSVSNENEVQQTNRIQLFHDIYDVPLRTKDRKRLDESRETYEYMLCGICPVEFSKAGLSYREDRNDIGVSDRFWMVGAPEIGFTYPAFANGGADASAVMYYVKTGKDPHDELVQAVLACDPKRTADQEKKAFQGVVTDAFEDPQQGESVYLRFQKQLSEMTDPSEDAPAVPVTRQVMADVISQVDMPEEAKEIIQEAFADAFGEVPPMAENLLDQKLVDQSIQRIRTLELETEVTGLKEELGQKNQELTETKQELQIARAAAPEEGTDAAISLRVTPQKARKIHAQMIGGVKHLVVPLEAGDLTRINGEEFDF